MTAQTAQLIQPGALFTAPTFMGIQVVEVQEPMQEDGHVPVLTVFSDGETHRTEIFVDVLLKAYTYVGDVNRVRPGALFTYHESEDFPILVVEVVSLDMEDNAAICVESLSNDATLSPAVFDVDILANGAFTFVGTTVPDHEHALNPRVGDLFAYTLNHSYDFPSTTRFVAEVYQLESDGSVIVNSYQSDDARPWFEMWSPSERTTFVYLGRVADTKE